MKLSLVFIAIFMGLLCNVSSAQTLQLYLENFNGPTHDFILNNGGPGSNAGNNSWVVNDEYDGKGIYPNTTSQTNTASGGTISKPDSNYLHIRNSAAAPNVANCNYDNTNASDNFSYMRTGFCTLGLTDVHFTFFYLAGGNTNDYGRVYYSLDNGPWIQCGALQYTGQAVWNYADISLPAFNDHADVRFGFRWSNSNGATANNMSFGIDDVIAAGKYDANNPVTIEITAVSPATTCKGSGDGIIISYKFSKPLCTGGYMLEMSNSQGVFAPGVQLYPVNITRFDTEGTVVAYLPPTASGCIKFRLRGIFPLPDVVSTASECVNVEDCPNTIETLQPAVTKGPDTLCVNSVIDVPFFSTGTFYGSNQYIAQMSNASGSFANPIELGRVPDQFAHPGPPGSVSGLIPDVPAGCNYYIRVISTGPSVIPGMGASFGPFCLRHCDVTTNDTKDVSVCINETTGDQATIQLDIHSWNNIAQYGAGNSFIVQLLKTDYTLINTGGLGAVVSTTNTTMTLTVPNLVTLSGMGLGIGTYYMRFISTNSNSQSDTLGTLIRLKIGYQYTIKPTLTSVDGNTFEDKSVFCVGELFSIVRTDGRSGTNYIWNASYNNVRNLTYNDNYFTFVMQSFDVYFTVQMEHNGCMSPVSDTIWVRSRSKPSAALTVTTPLCVGDTSTFSVPFQDDTYFEWDVLADDNIYNIISNSNNELKVVFNEGGTYDVKVSPANMCGNATATKPFTIYPKPILNPSPSEPVICSGSPIELRSNTDVTSELTWYLLPDTLTGIGNTTDINVSPAANSTYLIKAISDQGCKHDTTITLTVNPVPEVAIDARGVACYQGADGSITSLVEGGTAPYTYAWSNNATTATLVDMESGTYALTVTDSNNCISTAETDVESPSPVKIGFTTTLTLFGQETGRATARVTGGTPPYSLVWDTDPVQTTATITRLAAGEYNVTVTDAEGCSYAARVEITFSPNELFVPSAFSPNGDGRNDIFEFSGMNLKSFTIVIYNRWGQQLFQSASQDILWDGTFKGKPVDIGVYAYFIEAVFLDGQKIIKKGNISVLR